MITTEAQSARGIITPYFFFTSLNQGQKRPPQKSQDDIKNKTNI